MYIISFGYGVTIIIIENKSDKDAWRKFLVKIGINESVFQHLVFHPAYEFEKKYF